MARARRALMAGGIIAILLLPVSPSLACTCLRHGTVADRFEAYDGVIFIGTARAVKRIDRSYSIVQNTKFHVEWGVKGDVSRRETVRSTPADQGEDIIPTCSTGFSPGERYQVWGHRLPSGLIDMGFCSETKSIRSVGELYRPVMFAPEPSDRVASVAVPAPDRTGREILIVAAATTIALASTLLGRTRANRRRASAARR